MGRILYENKRVGTGYLVLIYLGLFPFGQVFKLLLGFNLVDLVVFVASLLYLLFNVRRMGVIQLKFLPGFDLLLTLSYSFVVSIVLFDIGIFNIGFLYLLRFASYIVFSYVVFDLVNKKILLREKLYDALLIVSVVSAIFGILQYLIFPDTRDLYLFGWDDHLNRLIGTFLDPAFSGLIFALGLVLIVNRLFVKARLWEMGGFLILFIALMFTYSRSSYLAFTLGVLVLAYFYGKLRYFLAFLMLMLLLVVALPRGEGAGVNLARTHSVFQKVSDYKETVLIVERYPLFGVGFNNLCEIKLSEGMVAGVNSCSGADNSYLFILATVGAIGGIAFLKFLHLLFADTEFGFYGKAFYASSAVVGIHAMFTNSLFYIFVMGWMGILIAISRAKE